MAAFGTKVVVLMMVLPSLLLLQTSSVEAVDIVAYNENTSCSGTVAGGCYNIAANTCCVLNGTGAPAVQILNLLDGESASIYNGGECTTEVIVGYNVAEECANSSSFFTGAKWVSTT